MRNKKIEISEHFEYELFDAQDQLIKFKEECQMWRELYVESLNLTGKELEFMKDAILLCPGPIVNFKDFYEKSLKCAKRLYE